MTLKRQKVVFPTTAKVTAAFVLALSTACPAVAVPTPFDVVKGSWVGGGGLNFKDGRSEKLACTAYYTSSGEGEALTTALRCTGPSGKLELRSHLSYAGGKVSGSWEERTYNASGDASGTLNSRQPALEYQRRRRGQHDGRILRRKPDGLHHTRHERGSREGDAFRLQAGLS